MTNKFIKTIFAFLICIILSFSLSAQNGTERVKNRAENRTNQRIDQKIDQGVDRTLDKIEGLFRKKKDRSQTEEEAPTQESPEYNEEEEMADKEEKQASSFLGSLKIGGDFEPFENPVKMNLSMEITTVNQRGKSEKVGIDYTFDTWATAMIMTSEENTVRMLLDNKDGYQTIITTDKGETQAFRMRQMAIDLSDFTPEENEFTVTKTGKTRTIDGYHCEEYLIEHEDGNTNSWITQDVEIDMLGITQAMASQARNKKMPTQNYFGLKGVPIEAISVSKNGKETTTIHFYNFKTGNNVNLDAFDTTGVEIMSMGF